MLFLDEPERGKDWQAVKDDIIATWIAEHPGTRPFAWWQYDSPGPRSRVGGIGTPAHEVLAYVPAFNRGIPTKWVSRFDVEYYNGRAKDIHGNRIGAEYTEGHFPYDAIDPADPPRFESEASYLRRLGLFLPGEEKRLTDADFQPEVIS